MARNSTTTNLGLLKPDPVDKISTNGYWGIDLNDSLDTIDGKLGPYAVGGRAPFYVTRIDVNAGSIRVYPGVRGVVPDSVYGTVTGAYSSATITASSLATTASHYLYAYASSGVLAVTPREDAPVWDNDRGMYCNTTTGGGYRWTGVPITQSATLTSRALVAFGRGENSVVIDKRAETASGVSVLSLSATSASVSSVPLTTYMPSSEGLLSIKLHQDIAYPSASDVQSYTLLDATTTARRITSLRVAAGGFAGTSRQACTMEGYCNTNTISHYMNTAGTASLGLVGWEVQI